MTTNQVNYLNIGLMLGAMVAAFVLPFHVFLFSYAVLGPLHYLTEVSWLHDREYFSRRRHDYLILAGLCVPILMGSGLFRLIHIPLFGRYTMALTIIAFGMALVLTLVEDVALRMAWGAAIAATAFIVHFAGWNWGFTLFAVFLPTLIHVYVFTGAFMLFGALKGNSRSGYASVGVFVGCAVVLLAIDSGYTTVAIGETAKDAYSRFAVLNVELAGLLNLYDTAPGGVTQSGLFPFASYDEIFTSKASIVLSRFIAFAYTYHYLNWFSKTSVIKWHHVPKLRFAVVIAAWITSVALYAIDYRLGFSWLFLLSFMHVFLEFPLNWRSFMGIGEEVKRRAQRVPVLAD